MKGVRMTRQVIVTKEDDWFVATDIVSHVASQGKTIEKALANLKEALELYYEDDDAIDNANEEMQTAFLTTLEVFA